MLTVRTALTSGRHCCRRFRQPAPPMRPCLRRSSTRLLASSRVEGSRHTRSTDRGSGRSRSRGSLEMRSQSLGRAPQRNRCARSGLKPEAVNGSHLSLRPIRRDAPAGRKQVRGLRLETACWLAGTGQPLARTFLWGACSVWLWRPRAPWCRLAWGTPAHSSTPPDHPAFARSITPASWVRPG